MFFTPIFTPPELARTVFAALPITEVAVRSPPEDRPPPDPWEPVPDPWEPAEGARLGFGEAFGAGGATTVAFCSPWPEFWPEFWPDPWEPDFWPWPVDSAGFDSFFDDPAVRRVEPLDVRMIFPEPGFLLSLTLPHPRCRSEALRPHLPGLRHRLRLRPRPRA